MVLPLENYNLVVFYFSKNVNISFELSLVLKDIIPYSFSKSTSLITLNFWSTLQTFPFTLFKLFIKTRGESRSVVKKFP